jgi:hypothetical protein
MMELHTVCSYVAITIAVIDNFFYPNNSVQVKDETCTNKSNGK